MAAGSGSSNNFDEQLVLDLFDVEAVKFGTFTLKSGLTSPIYLDLRVIVSYPKLLDRVAKAMWDASTKEDADGTPPATDFQHMCGVPYTALPIATVMSMHHETSMVMRRKEVKDYGTKKAIEGAYKPDDVVLVVEDLVTSGMSVWETVEPLQHHKLAVKDVVVLIDRQQGGRAFLKSRGLVLHAALTITGILDVLVAHKKVTPEVQQSVLDFIAANQNTTGNKVAEAPPKWLALSYGTRAKSAKCPAAANLLELMERKKTNLCASLDVTTSAELLKLAEEVGPQVCCVKTHCDVVSDWTEATGAELQRLAKAHDFVVFEDRKFADIGNTAALQYECGLHKISSWSDFVNAHITPGPFVIDALKGVKGAGACLLLAEMSSKGTVATGDAYVKSALDMADAHPDFVMGFIDQTPKNWKCAKDVDPGYVHMTPGISLASKGDKVGQQYTTPHMAIVDNGADVVIVGRGIYGASDAKSASAEYREAGWKAYEARLQM